jgi:hypothetical protein
MLLPRTAEREPGGENVLDYSDLGADVVRNTSVFVEEVDMPHRVSCHHLILAIGLMLCGWCTCTGQVLLDEPLPPAMLRCGKVDLYPDAQSMTIVGMVDSLWRPWPEEYYHYYFLRFCTRPYAGAPSVVTTLDSSEGYSTGLGGRIREYHYAMAHRGDGTSWLLWTRTLMVGSCAESHEVAEKLACQTFHGDSVRTVFTRDSSQKPSIALAGDGTVHCLWEHLDSEVVSDWSYTIPTSEIEYRSISPSGVVSDIGSIGVGCFSRLVVDNAGTAHIAWFEPDSARRMYALCYRTCTGTTFSPVLHLRDSLPPLLSAMEISVDNSGAFHAAWLNGTRNPDSVCVNSLRYSAGVDAAYTIVSQKGSWYQRNMADYATFYFLPDGEGRHVWTTSSPDTLSFATYRSDGGLDAIHRIHHSMCSPTLVHNARRGWTLFCDDDRGGIGCFPDIETGMGTLVSVYPLAGTVGCMTRRALVDPDDNIWLLLESRRNGMSMGMHLVKLGPDVVATDHPSPPPDIGLDQNYPNPVSVTSASTAIRFSLPRAQRAVIRLYTLVGTEIGVVAEGDYAAGDHTVSLPTHDLKPGVYVYCLTAGSSTLTRMVTVVR